MRRTFLLLAQQLRTVLRQAALLALALHAARRHFEALRLEQAHAALQEQIRFPRDETACTSDRYILATPNPWIDLIEGGGA